MKYPASGLTAVQDGATVDVRFRLALELAKAPGFLRHWTERSVGAEFGEFCCQVAQSLYAHGEKLGWVAPLSCETELTPADQAHVERSAGAQAHSQVHAQKVGQALMQGSLRGLRGEIVS